MSDCETPASPSSDLCSIKDILKENGITGPVDEVAIERAIRRKDPTENYRDAFLPGLEARRYPRADAKTVIAAYHEWEAHLVGNPKPCPSYSPKSPKTPSMPTSQTIDGIQWVKFLDVYSFVLQVDADDERIKRRACAARKRMVKVCKFDDDDCRQMRKKCFVSVNVLGKVVRFLKNSLPDSYNVSSGNDLLSAFDIEDINEQSSSSSDSDSTSEDPKQGTVDYAGHDTEDEDRVQPPPKSDTLMADAPSAETDPYGFFALLARSDPARAASLAEAYEARMLIREKANAFRVFVDGK
jgi:hypothetical protein